MKKILIIIFLIFLSINSYCQRKDVLYIDEDYKKISLKEFNRKIKSDLFLIATVENDTVIFKKLRYKEYFGKLDSKKKNQLNKLFQKRYNIDSTKTWLIHYQDSLPNIKLMPKISGIVYLDSTKRRHKHVLSYIADKRIIPRELKKYRKIKNVQLVHFYEINKGYPAITKNING